jgi:quercetin dioxygenase-like cupin family protein
MRPAHQSWRIVAARLWQCQQEGTMAEKTLKLAALAVLGSVALAQAPHDVRVTRATENPAVRAPEANFTGAVRLQSRFNGEAPSRVRGALVTFEPRARTNWHTHPLGQSLVITQGSGFVQSWGGPRQEFRAGDVVWIPPNTKHWHGAGEAESMSHVAITEALDGEVVAWLERVTDEQYGGK